jgi:hypothetical protein
MLPPQRQVGIVPLDDTKPLPLVVEGVFNVMLGLKPSAALRLVRGRA